MTGYTVDFDIYTGREIRVRTQLRCGNEVSAATHLSGLRALCWQLLLESRFVHRPA